MWHEICLNCIKKKTLSPTPLYFPEIIINKRHLSSQQHFFDLIFNHPNIHISIRFFKKQNVNNIFIPVRHISKPVNMPRFFKMLFVSFVVFTHMFAVLRYKSLS